MGVLKARVNGVWEEVVPAAEPQLDEVWVGAGPPDPVGQYEIWVDNTVDPAVLHFQDQIGAWHELDTGNEVTIAPTDPYITNPESADELWYDSDARLLYARLGTPPNARWQQIAPLGTSVSFGTSYGQTPQAGTLPTYAHEDHSHGTPPEEVIIKDVAPPVDDHDLWLDTSVDPAILKASVGGQWVAITSEQVDEVWVGFNPPPPSDGAELWADTSFVPAALKHQQQDGTWVELGPDEIHVGVEDPYVLNTAARTELWMDTSLAQDAKLKYRSGGQWRHLTEITESEVETGTSDPKSYNSNAELWIDTASTPATLHGWVNGGWQQLTGPDPMVPQEVEIGPADPRDNTVELWYDTTGSPDNGVLRANNNGVWEPINGAEVEIAHTDPYTTNPGSAAELWYDTGRGVPGILYARTGGATGQWVAITQYGGVAYEQQYGQEPNVGTQNAAARADHSHGTPPEEVWIGAGDPIATRPDLELWYDTDAIPGVSTASASTLTTRIQALETRLAALEARS